MNRLFFLLILFVSPPLLAHWDSAYFRNADDGFTSKNSWMNDIRDDAMLSEMAIPGTHDSGTYDKHIESVITQTLNFKKQLEYGIRVFDIRIRHTSDRFALHHGSVFLNVMFGDFLNDVDNFLTNNPSETILFRIKEEHTANSNNTRSLKDTLDYYLSSHSDKYLKTTNKGLKLGEARGKFIILSNVSDFNTYGLNYSTFNIQDKYNLRTNWDLHDYKWGGIKSQLSTAISGSKNIFYVNYLSGSGGSFPYFVASGHSSPGTSSPRLSTGLTTPGWKNSYPDFPRVSCFIGICTIAFEGTNILTRNRLSSYNVIMSLLNNMGISGLFGFNRSAGIIMADFPGESLIKNVIDNNVFLKKQTSNYLQDSLVNEYIDSPALDEDIIFNIKKERPDVYDALQEKIIDMKQENIGNIKNKPEIYDELLKENR